jgi:hypothetical protein
MMKCDGCGKTIKDNYFVSDESIYCEECGLELLVYNEYLEGYVLNEDNQLFYLDDDLSDIEVFKEETLTAEELELLEEENQ